MPTGAASSVERQAETKTYGTSFVGSPILSKDRCVRGAEKYSRAFSVRSDVRLMKIS
jgi:hypothetical protein